MPPSLTNAATKDAHTQRLPLAGRRAIVTGGSTGIGRAIAVLLASEGARVFIGGTEQGHVDDALARIREVGEGEGIALDLSREDNVARFVAAAGVALGSYDIVVANAAEAAEGLSDMDELAVRHAVSLNFTQYLLLSRAAAEAMPEGDIVLIGSMSAYALGPESTVYAGIKHGLQGFSIALRRELGPKGIRVALVEPGLTGSDMQLPDIQPEKQREMIDKDEMLRAEDIAVGVHYLLTQPRRAVIQRLTIAPRMQDGE